MAYLAIAQEYTVSEDYDGLKRGWGWHDRCWYLYQAAQRCHKKVELHRDTMHCECPHAEKHGCRHLLHFFASAALGITPVEENEPPQQNMEEEKSTRGLLNVTRILWILSFWCNWKGFGWHLQFICLDATNKLNLSRSPFIIMGFVDADKFHSIALMIS